jgi:endoglucanase
MDSGAIYNKEIHGILTGIADRNNIPRQTKTYIAGATDGSVFQRSRSGIKTAGIAAPIRNLHSPTCVGNLSDMDAVCRIIRLFLESF